ncbi:MAG: hypothetical protein V2I43_07805 [Parvularcula sp.]|jgi:hypothetical protein|nr:hypothetical protein [Parvularcula sp.]
MMAISDWFKAQDRIGKATIILIGALFLYGIFFRILPLLEGPEATAFRFISEDGYLLLTVARNMGIGEGMTVSDGTIGTNGIQPLIGFLYAAAFVLSGGDKVGGLVIIMIMMTALSIFGAWTVFRFSSRALAAQTDSLIWPGFAAAIWFVSVLPVAHTMNALETGLYTALGAITFTYFAELSQRDRSYTLREQIILGSLCGLCFLARIDGAMLVTAIFAVRLVVRLTVYGARVQDVVLEAIPPGLISLAFAAPWLLTNYLRFGSIMPISGPAQSINAEFGQNIPLLPSKLFEQVVPILPVPGSFETKLPISILLLLAAGFIITIFLRTQFIFRSQTRYAVCAYLIFGLGLSSYYGLFFGAPHFLSRYTFPLSPLGITALVSTVLTISAFLPRLSGILRTGFVSASVLVAVIVTTDRFVVTPKAHDHIQVARWVEQNVSNDIWVGAVQTGTVGFWHDRTINLDGKVNPQALAARISDGDVLNYVGQSEIDVLADWRGIAAWKVPGSESRAPFIVLVDDRKANLGVQIRQGTDLGKPDGRGLYSSK